MTAFREANVVKVTASADNHITVPCEQVYRILADYLHHHPHILPPAFSHFSVGAGTVIRFKVTIAGRSEWYHQRIEEPDPRRILREVDMNGDRTTTFTVTPAEQGCHVRIETVWRPGGIRGLVERVVAPQLLRTLYEDERSQLNRYAREHVADI